MSKEISLLGKNIKIRGIKGLITRWFSKLTDISYNTVIKLESGGTINPLLGILPKLVPTLNVSVNNLLW